MATETIAGPQGEVRSASTAGGGTALTTSAARIVLPRNTKQITLIPRNYSTAVVVKWNKNPFLIVLKTTDLLATAGNLTDYSDNAQDNSTSTDVTLSSLATVANKGAVYVGSWTPFSGLEVDVDAANGTASVLTVTYWDGSAWTDTSATDGTASGGATFAVDGNITWTVPSAWVTASLQEAVTTALPHTGILTQPMYWVRLAVSAALDSSTTLNSMIAINRDTTYAEIPAGMWWEESITVGPGGYYSITALTDAGTANLVVNCAARGKF